MAKGLFPKFMTTLRARWKSELPSILPLKAPTGDLPKSSTFYAGLSSKLGKHVYFYFQHSPKSWRLGEFTINVVVAEVRDNPQVRGIAVEKFGEGVTRIGHIVGKRDKWWHLKQNERQRESRSIEAWRASRYDDDAVVFSEIATNVTTDIREVLRQLEIP